MPDWLRQVASTVALFAGAALVVICLMVLGGNVMGWSDLAVIHLVNLALGFVLGVVMIVFSHVVWRRLEPVDRFEQAMQLLFVLALLPVLWIAGFDGDAAMPWIFGIAMSSNLAVFVRRAWRRRVAARAG